VPITRKSRHASKNRKLIIFTGLIMGLVVLSFSDLGLIRYFQLKRENNRLISQINDLKDYRDALHIEKKRLEEDLGYIEKIAREKFRMVKPGEKVFRGKDNRTVSPSD